MRLTVRILFVTLWFAIAVGAQDLAAVKAEPDLNKRAELAMANADQSVNLARRAFEAGKTDQADSALKDIQKSVQLAYESLRETRKQPRNNKYYKRVELAMQSLMRRVEGLSHDAPYEERGTVEQVEKRLQDLHDQILLDIMSKRK